MNKVAKATIGLMVATIIAKVLGFGRELVLASSYGASMYSDAYITAMNIPLVIFASIGGALGTTFIPMYCNIDNTFGEKRSLKYTNNIFNIVIVLSITLAVLGYVFAEPLVKLFAFGFKEETFQITVNFTRIIIMGTVFTGIGFVMTSYLQVKNNFIIPGLTSLPKNIIIISSIILSTKYGPYTMIWGTVLGLASEFLFQLPFAIKNGYKYTPHINLKDENLRKTIWLIGPVLIGVGVNQINAMVDRALASNLAVGSISALNYSNKLNGFVMVLFISSISTVIYPMLSKLSSEDNKEKFNQSIVQSINSVILLILPISVGAITLATPIVKILFQRGEFDTRATSMTAIALAMYSIGMIAFGLRDILGKVFYSLQDTKTPMVNGAIAVVMNISVNLVLVRYLKHAGLALGTSISAIVCIILLFRSLKKKIGYFGQDKILKTTFKSLLASIVMGGITIVTYNLLSQMLGVGFVKEFIALFSSIFIGAFTYGIMVIVLKVEEINVIVMMAKRKLKLAQV
ncbi:murein biosynthesis integral membrane protein MurJ [Romboutsia sp.]|uniref:murein biosynthesis integral membrane protein MurJ n=1 Tax=Romboutsia sp. TaxID=1965302 RepID=UPI003F2D2AA2